MNTRLTALVTVLAIVAAAALLVTPGGTAQVAASQNVDARIAGHVLKIKGTKDDDKLALRLNARDANTLEVAVGDDGTADFSFDRALFTEIKVNARQGNDFIRVDEVNGPIVEPTSFLGGNGNDTILGGSAIETINGGDGDDFIDGNRGNDVAFMGAGDDTFRWDPGDGSDVVEGQDGSDTLLFNGSNGGETVDLSANGDRFIFFRQPGSVTMDVNELETSVFNALGGPDTITVSDLTGTDVTRVDLNLDAGLGGGTGDGQPDQVTVDGTAGDDNIVIAGSAGSVEVTGLSATVAIRAAEAANDLLSVNALGGDDTVDASALQAAAIKELTDGVPVDDPPNTPSPAPTASPSPTPTGTISPTATDTPSPTAVAPTAVPTAAPARPTAAVLAGPLSFPNAGGSAGSHGSGLALFLASVPIGIIVSAGGWVLGQAAARRRGPRS